MIAYSCFSIRRVYWLVSGDTNLENDQWEKYESMNIC